MRPRDTVFSISHGCHDSFEEIITSLSMDSSSRMSLDSEFARDDEDEPENCVVNRKMIGRICGVFD